MAKLVDLHPQSALPGPPSSDLAEALVFSEDEVKAAVMSFHPESAGGSTCLRGQHLKDAISCCCLITAQSALAQLTRLTNVLAAGESPSEVAPFLAGAPLTPL